MKLLKNILGLWNYLWINKYGNVFQYKVNVLRIYLFEDKLKMNNWNCVFINILECKFTMEFINEKGNLFINKRWFIFEVCELIYGFGT